MISLCVTVIIATLFLITWLSTLNSHWPMSEYYWRRARAGMSPGPHGDPPAQEVHTIVIPSRVLTALPGMAGSGHGSRGGDRISHPTGALVHKPRWARSRLHPSRWAGLGTNARQCEKLALWQDCRQVSNVLLIEVKERKRENTIELSSPNPFTLQCRCGPRVLAGAKPVKARARPELARVAGERGLERGVWGAKCPGRDGVVNRIGLGAG